MKRIVAAIAIAAIAFSSASFSYEAPATQDNGNAKPTPYQIKSFRTYKIDTSKAMDEFDADMNKWLREHPDIENPHHAESHSRVLDASGKVQEVRIISLLYQEKQ